MAYAGTLKKQSAAKAEAHKVVVEVITEKVQPERDLTAVQVGQRAIISAITSCPKDLLHKLVSMGLVAGTEVRVTQRGFFGSPINVHLLGSVLSLRSAEAAHIQVQPIV